MRAQYSPEPADGGCRLAVRSNSAAGLSTPTQVVASAGTITLAHGAHSTHAQQPDICARLLSMIICLR